MNDSQTTTTLLPNTQEENQKNTFLEESNQQVILPPTQDDDDDEWILCGDKSGKNSSKSVKQGKNTSTQQVTPVITSAPIKKESAIPASVASASMEEETISLRKSLYYEVINLLCISYLVD